MKPTPTLIGVAMLLPALLAAQVTCNSLPLSPFPAPDDGGFVEPFSFSLRVARHIDQPFSEEHVDSVFAEASSILQTVQTDCPDVACPVTFERYGAVDSFDVGSAVITTEAQLDEVFEHPADIKIVTLMVGVCGSFRPGDLAQVLGCAATGASVVIAHDAPSDVWAHEWGHVQGLAHRDDCYTNIMHSVALETNAVNARERDAFLSPTPSYRFLKAPSPGEAALGACLARMDGEPLSDWLERILSRRYLTGLPQSFLADAPTPETTAHLLDLLVGQPTDVQRTNSVRALGLLGDPQACPALIGSIDALRGPLTTAELATASEAFLALGRLAGGDLSDAAIDYLIAGTAPETWRQRDLVLPCADREDTALEGVFARFCIMSLVLAEHPSAHAHLSDLQRRINAGRLSGPWLAEQVAEAIARLEGDATVLRPSLPADRIP